MAIVLVLVSAFLHALWNALLKRERDKTVVGVAVVAGAAIVAGVAAVIEGAATGRAPFAHRGALGWSLAAGLCEGAYFITLVMALDRGPLGLAYTVSRGTAILLVWPVSVLWLDEPLTALSAAGSAVLLMGLVLAGWEPGDRPGGRAVALLCGGCIAAYHLCYKRAMAAEPSAAAVFAVALAVALPLNVARLDRAGRAALRVIVASRPLPLFAYGAVCATSFVVFLIALKDTGAGLVLTLRNSSVLFALLIAWMLGQPPGRRRLAGALLVAVGAALVGSART